MKKVEYDYAKLKGKVREVFGTNENYASFLNISEGSLYEKYKSDSYFNQKQIMNSIQKFGESEERIPEYFFKKKVEINSICDGDKLFIEETES